MKVNGKEIHGNYMCFYINICVVNVDATSSNNCNANLLTCSGLTTLWTQLFVRRSQVLSGTKEVALWVIMLVVV
jgi:hypothetical protein